MLTDHIGDAIVYRIMGIYYSSGDYIHYNSLVLPYKIMRGFGRLGFPIFCFLLVEGFYHTRSRLRYARNLFLFALISEFPFDFALKNAPFYPEKQNVFWTLLIALIVIWIIDFFQYSPSLMYLALVFGMMFARALNTDYNYKGVFLITVLYLFHSYRSYQCIAGAAVISYEKWAPIAYLLCWMYNGKRGLRLKYLFYTFYPGHLLVLGLIRYFVLPRFF